MGFYERKLSKTIEWIRTTFFARSAASFKFFYMTAPYVDPHRAILVQRCCRRAVASLASSGVSYFELAAGGRRDSSMLQNIFQKDEATFFQDKEIFCLRQISYSIILEQ